MTHETETLPAADEGRLDRRVRAHDPERAAFEAWWCKAYHPAALLPVEDGCYMNAKAGLAWDAWNAARPPRHEIGRLVNLAAECAQRKPLTDEEALAIIKSTPQEDVTQEGWIRRQRLSWVRAIERAHGITGEPT